MPLARQPLRPRLAHSLAATAWMVGAPLVVTVALVSLLRPGPMPYFSAGVTVVASLLAAAAGARYWSTRPGSRWLRFSELMVWSWLRRGSAERRLEQGARLLELDGELFGERPWLARPRQELRGLTKLAGALERKDLYTLGHSRRVARSACRTAVELGVPEDDLDELAEAAALHDVGKIRIPDTILRKDGSLSERELSVVREHSDAGARLVSRLGNSRLTSAVLHHHERWDGGGYPRGLSGEAIPLFARIIAVADTYDAMTSDRPYRRALDPERALAAIKEQSGRQFDPRVVAAFERSRSDLVPVPALSPLLMIGRRLLRTPLGGGSAAAPSTTAVATAAVVAAGLLSLPPAHPVSRVDPGESSGLVAAGPEDIAAPENEPPPRRTPVNGASARERRRPDAPSGWNSAGASRGPDQAAYVEGVASAANAESPGDSPPVEANPAAAPETPVASADTLVRGLPGLILRRSGTFLSAEGAGREAIRGLTTGGIASAGKPAAGATTSTAATLTSAGLGS